MNDINPTVEISSSLELTPKSVLEQVLLNSVGLVSNDRLPRVQLAALSAYRAVTQGREDEAELVTEALISGYRAIQITDLQVDAELMLARALRLQDLSVRVEEIDGFGSLLKLPPEQVQKITGLMANKRTLPYRIETNTSAVGFIDGVDLELAWITRRLYGIESDRYHRRVDRKYKNPSQLVQALASLVEEAGIPLGYRCIC